MCPQVKCRNTNVDAEISMTLLELQQSEQEFFASHPELQHVPGMGSVALANALDEIQKDLLFKTDVIAKRKAQVCRPNEQSVCSACWSMF